MKWINNIYRQSRTSQNLFQDKYFDQARIAINMNKVLILECLDKFISKADYYDLLKDLVYCCNINNKNKCFAMVTSQSGLYYDPEFDL